MQQTAATSETPRISLPQGAGDEGHEQGKGVAAAPVSSAEEAWAALHATAAAMPASLRLALHRVPTGPTRAAYDHGATEGPCVNWMLDHILYTPRALSLVSRWATLEAEPEAVAAGLPNKWCPSDHIAVAATFAPVPPAALGPAERDALLSKIYALRATHGTEREALTNQLAEETSALEQVCVVLSAALGVGC